MIINRIIHNTYGEIFPEEDPAIYELILSYHDLCEIFGWNKEHTISNILEAPHATFQEWFHKKNDYCAAVIFPYAQRVTAYFEDEGDIPSTDDWDGLEEQIWVDRELMKIRVASPDLTMAFLLHWTGQQTKGEAA